MCVVLSLFIQWFCAEKHWWLCQPHERQVRIRIEWNKEKNRWNEGYGCARANAAAVAAVPATATTRTVRTRYLVRNNGERVRARNCLKAAATVSLLVFFDAFFSSFSTISSAYSRSPRACVCVGSVQRRRSIFDVVGVLCVSSECARLYRVGNLCEAHYYLHICCSGFSCLLRHFGCHRSRRRSRFSVPFVYLQVNCERGKQRVEVDVMCRKIAWRREQWREKG